MSATSDGIWTLAERRAWAPPEQLTCSEWAAKYRIITGKDAAEPGKWRHQRAPYLVGVMDAFSEPDIDTVVIRKAARIGGSEATRNAIGYWLDQDPGPIMIVYPTKESAQEQITNEIIPMLEDCPRLRRHSTGRAHDTTKNEIETLRARIYIGYGGSPQSLASRTIRFLIFDESDKAPPHSGAEADPLSLARRRLQTFGRRKKLVVISTPTTRDGVISKCFDACVDQRYYHVPCPHCGELQILAWAQLKWPKGDPDEDKNQRANRVLNDQSAWYECPACHGRIEERHKGSMIDEGLWVSKGYEPGEHPSSRSVAFQLSSLSSQLGITWSQIAAEWIGAQGDIGALMEFATQCLGEAFEEQVEAVSARSFGKRRDHEPGKVPSWAGRLISAADTQRHGFYWVTRAWGRNERSRLIAFGEATSFDDLRRKTLDASYDYEGGTGAISPDMLLIDSGGSNAQSMSFADAVYQFAARDPRIFAIKGSSAPNPARDIMRRRTDASRKTGGDVWLLDTNKFKDLLAARIQMPAQHDGGHIWEVNSAITDEYISHMTGEHKIQVRKGRTSRIRWVPRTAGRRVDYWDCEVYLMAGARLGKVANMPSEPELVAARERAHRPAPERKREEGGGWVNGQGWWKGRK